MIDPYITKFILSTRMPLPRSLSKPLDSLLCQLFPLCLIFILGTTTIIKVVGAIFIRIAVILA